MGNPFRGCPFSCFLCCPLGSVAAWSRTPLVGKWAGNNARKSKYRALLNENRGKNGVKIKKNSQNCPFFFSFWPISDLKGDCLKIVLFLCKVLINSILRFWIVVYPPQNSRIWMWVSPVISKTEKMKIWAVLLLQIFIVYIY